MMHPLQPRVPPMSWKSAVAPSPVITLADVATAFAWVVVLAAALLCIDIGFRALGIGERDQPRVAQSFAKAVLERNLDSVRHPAVGAQPVQVTYQQASTELAAFAPRGSLWKRGLDRVLQDPESSLGKLHALLVAALLAALAVALGIFLFRLLAYAGIVDPDLVRKVKEAVAGSPEKAGGKAPLPWRTGLVGHAVTTVLPLAVLGGAAAATLAIQVHGPRLDPITVSVVPPPSVPVRIDAPSQLTIPVSLVPTKVSFTTDKLPIPVTVRATPSAITVSNTGTLSMEAADLKLAARALSEAAGKFTNASVALDQERGSQIKGLTESTGNLARATFATASDLAYLNEHSVGTEFMGAGPCTQGYLDKLKSANADQLKAEAKNIRIVSGDTRHDELVGLLKVPCKFPAVR